MKCSRWKFQVSHNGTSFSAHLPKVDDVALAVALFVGVLEDVAVATKEEAVDGWIDWCQLEILDAKYLGTRTNAKVLLNIP